MGREMREFSGGEGGGGGRTRLPGVQLRGGSLSFRVFPRRFRACALNLNDSVTSGARGDQSNDGLFMLGCRKDADGPA